MEDSNIKYDSIISSVKSYSDKFDEYIYSYFQKHSEHVKNPIFPIIKSFIQNKGKRIRSKLIFLLTKALSKEVEPFHYKLALVQEFIHNATLIHDDIIDCSKYRRGKKTLNTEYDSKLAVLAGDFLLSEAIQIIDTFNNKKIRNIHSFALKELINGELKQYFNRYEILSFDDYIEKSKAKTARLFECGLYCVSLNYKDEFIENIRQFALNFGIAFQIRNDINNFDDNDKICEDIKNGDYSAPVIFYAQEKGMSKINSNDVNELVFNIKKTDVLHKTNELIKQFSDIAIENIAFLEDNLYKQSLIDLCRLLKNE